MYLLILISLGLLAWLIFIGAAHFRTLLFEPVILDIEGSGLRYWRKEEQLIKQSQRGSIIIRSKEPNPNSRAYYSGRIKIPHKIYEGDSRSISAFFDTGLWIERHSGEKGLLRSSSDEKASPIIFKIGQEYLEPSLEIELLAAGIKIDGKKKSLKKLELQPIPFEWSCYFPNSGIHEITLIFRLVSSAGVAELGKLNHSIKVVRLDHLTKRQVWLFVGILAVLSGLLSAVKILFDLGVFN